MTSMTVDYPTRLVYTTPWGHTFLMGTTQACIMKDIMCSCLTTVVAHRYKEYYSATSSTAHAPKQLGLVKENTKLTFQTRDCKTGMDIHSYFLR